MIIKLNCCKILVRNKFVWGPGEGLRAMLVLLVACMASELVNRTYTINDYKIVVASISGIHLRWEVVLRLLQQSSTHSRSTGN